MKIDNLYNDIGQRLSAPMDAGGGSATSEELHLLELSEHDRFEYLMSLALDDMLSPDEAEVFERMLAEDSAHETEWSEWKAFDSGFYNAPAMEPPADFAATVEHKLVQQQRRRHLAFGVGIGITAFLLWVGLVTGLAGASAYVLFREAGWLASFVRYAAYCSVSVQNYWSAIFSTVSATISTPQLQAAVLLYLMFGIAALWIWLRALNRSVANPSPVLTINS